MKYFEKLVLKIKKNNYKAASTQSLTSTSLPIGGTDLQKMPLLLLFPQPSGAQWGLCEDAFHCLQLSAFDTITPSILLNKLSGLGFLYTQLPVRLDKLLSEGPSTDCETWTSSPPLMCSPQGCVLSPTLYWLYTCSSVEHQHKICQWHNNGGANWMVMSQPLGTRSRSWCTSNQETNLSLNTNTNN